MTDTGAAAPSGLPRSTPISVAKMLESFSPVMIVSFEEVQAQDTSSVLQGGRTSL